MTGPRHTVRRTKPAPRNDTVVKIRLPNKSLEILKLQAEASRTSVSDVLRTALDRSLSGIQPLSILDSFQGPVAVFTSAKSGKDDSEQESMGDLIALEAISSRLYRSGLSYPAVHPGTTENAARRELLSSNAILLGGPTGNHASAAFLDQLAKDYLNCSFEVSSERFHVPDANVDERIVRSTTSVLDCGALIWCRNPFARDSFVLLLFGAHSLGTYLAVSKAIHDSPLVGRPPLAAVWKISVDGAGIESSLVRQWQLTERRASPVSVFRCFEPSPAKFLRIVVPFTTKVGHRGKYQIQRYISATAIASLFFGKLRGQELRRNEDVSPFFLGDRDYLSESRDDLVIIGSTYNNETSRSAVELLRKRYGPALPAEIAPLHAGRPVETRLLDSEDTRCLVIRQGGHEKEQVFPSPATTPEDPDFLDYALFIKDTFAGRTIWLFQGTHAPGCLALLLALTEHSEKNFPSFPAEVDVGRPFACAIRARIVQDTPTDDVVFLGAWQLAGDKPTHRSKKQSSSDD